MDIVARIDAILSRVAQLRAAGVANLKIDGVSIDLLPYLAPSKDTAESKDVTLYNEHSDPLSDPATYAGGFVPGLEDA